MTPSRADLEIAVGLRAWAESRTTARKRAQTLAARFGRTTLTRRTRKQIEDTLLAAGVELRPSIVACDRDDLLELIAVGESPESARLPTQIVTWHDFNWTGEGDSGPTGEWLRCLRDTRSHDRQFVWSGSAVAGVVTFAGWIRRGTGFYDGWGSLSRLSAPVSRDALLADRRTAPRFDARGIKALQGSPIMLNRDLAATVSQMIGGLPSTTVPLDEPDYNERPILWAGLHGLSPEAYIEAEVATRRGLWRRLGFPAAPARQRVLGSAGRVDLISGDVVGEAKRAVTVRDGPAQIERYLQYLETEGRRPRPRLRGILLQCTAQTSRAVMERLSSSPYRLELWSVTRARRWQLDRLA
jgi:hypothetical protein